MKPERTNGKTGDEITEDRTEPETLCYRD